MKNEFIDWESMKKFQDTPEEDKAWEHLQKEKLIGMDKYETYEKFSGKIKKVKEEFVQHVGILCNR